MAGLADLFGKFSDLPQRAAAANSGNKNKGLLKRSKELLRNRTAKPEVGDDDELLDLQRKYPTRNKSVKEQLDDIDA